MSTDVRGNHRQRLFQVISCDISPISRMNPEKIVAGRLFYLLWTFVNFWGCRKLWEKRWDGRRSTEKTVAERDLIDHEVITKEFLQKGAQETSQPASRNTLETYTPSLPKSSKYLVSRCLEPLKAFSGDVWGFKHLLTGYLDV